MPLHKNQLEKCKQDLLAAKTNLSPVDRTDLQIERHPDTLDELQRIHDRELAVHLLNNNSSTIRAIESALERIEEGIYGICFDCEGEIAEPRLRVIPWAERCVNCQDKVDRTSKSHEEAAA